MWELDHKESWARKNWCFWTVVLEKRLLRVPWTARRSNQSILKEINSEYSLEGLMLKLKLQYFSHLKWRTDSLEKTDAGEDWKQKEKETTEEEMVGWHHWLDGHEFEQAPGAGDGQGSLACCSPWGHKELDITDQLNWTELSKRNKGITNTCSILGKPLKHNVERKEPDMRRNAMWFHLHSILKKQAGKTKYGA